jgi:hypothetical protein
MAYKIKKSIWDATSKDYKSIIKGQKYMLRLTEKGTALVPVQIVKDKKPKGYYASLTPEKKEQAYHFIHANYTNEDLSKMSQKEIDKILKKNKKEWNY